MKPFIVGLLLGFSTVLCAEETFVSGLSLSEREAIGLAGMTPEQIAALESAVQHYVQGRHEETVAVVQAEVRKEMEEQISERDSKLAAVERELTAMTEKAKSPPSFLERAKVILSPGTQVEYSTLESRLVEPFRGWQTGTLLKLENGQIWKIEDGKYWSPLEEAGKAVTIMPGRLGSFFMRIEGVKPTPKVTLFSTNSGSLEK